MLLSIVVFLVVATATFAWMQQRAGPERRPSPSLGVSTPHTGETGTCVLAADDEDPFAFDIVGERAYQESLEAVCGGRCEDGVEHDCVAVLWPDPENPHDPNAVKVQIDGRTVGYLTRDDALTFRETMARYGVDTPASCDALVVGGWDGGARGSGAFGVKLDLAWPPRPA